MKTTKKIGVGSSPQFFPRVLRREGSGTVSFGMEVTDGSGNSTDDRETYS